MARKLISPRTLAIACLSVLAVSTTHAQQMYVDDKLVLNVHSEPNQGGEKVATIETGDQVELLERADNYARVRLTDGREGWVGANYLTESAPAALRLKELQAADPSPDHEAAQKKLTDEVARLKKQNADLTEETSKLKKAAAAAAAAAATAAPAISVPPSAAAASPVSAESAPEPLSDSPTRDPWRWIWPAISVAVGGLAFLLGYQTLARRIRRKYGRVNII